MSVSRQNLWRKRQIILPEELVRRLDEWHGGQSSSVYALASTGRNHLVSLSMIDAASLELDRTKTHSKSKGARNEIQHVLNGLGDVAWYWPEYSAREAGLEDHDEGYDTRDYGFDAEDEAKLSRDARSGPGRRDG